MIQVYSDVVQFRGNHYDFGYMQGQLLKDSPILLNREKQWAAMRKRHFVIDEQEAIDLFTTFMPSMLDELQGLADALQWTLTDSLREFGGYYVEYGRSGCSILGGARYLVRNYDSHPGSYEGRYTMYQPTDTGYAVIGPSMQITGRTDGMNEKGLAMGYNFINRIRSDDGFVCNMIGRIILETCANVAEAIDLLKEIPHRTSFNYALLDPAGETYVVEASPRKVAVKQSTISTNHFDVLVDENRYRVQDSLRRHQLLEEQNRDDLSLYDAYRVLNDVETEVFSQNYGASAGTIHTSAYVPREGKALFSIGHNRPPVIFDFQRFVEGETIPVTKIKGELHYKTPFINMELIEDSM